MARKANANETVTDRHPVDEMLPPAQLFIYGLQHVMSMYAGVVAVPLIIGERWACRSGSSATSSLRRC